MNSTALEANKIYAEDHNIDFCAAMENAGQQNDDSEAVWDDSASFWDGAIAFWEDAA